MAAAVAAGAAVALASATSTLQPAPYMDEVFHVGQTQAYCAGRWSDWDGKITTPPGLYIIAAGVARLAATVMGGRADAATMCGTAVLRALAAGLATAVSVAVLVGGFRLRRRVAAAILLFPPLANATPLFYTDAASTAAVLTVWWLELGSHRPSALRLAATLLADLIALSLRQTNIVWIATAAAVATLREAEAATLAEAASACIAAAWRRRAALAPAAASALAFGCFVVWNGGHLALGDQGAHAPVLHAAQLAYLLAITGCYCSVEAAVVVVGRGGDGSVAAEWWGAAGSLVAASHAEPARQLAAPAHDGAGAGAGVVAGGATRWRLLRISPVKLAAWCAVVAAAAVALRHRSYAHPYLLADNRHIAFYVWQRLLGRYPRLRWMLAPVYVGCAAATLTRLAVAVRRWLRRAAGSGGVGAHNVRLGGHVGQLLIPVLWLVASAAVLVPAHLLEPRYFVMPVATFLLLTAVAETPLERDGEGCGPRSAGRERNDGGALGRSGERSDESAARLQVPPEGVAAGAGNEGLREQAVEDVSASHAMAVHAALSLLVAGGVAWLFGTRPLGVDGDGATSRLMW